MSPQALVDRAPYKRAEPTARDLLAEGLRSIFTAATSPQLAEAEALLARVIEHHTRKPLPERRRR
jgi:hypothetical protein